jgi:hypothetical protein
MVQDTQGSSSNEGTRWFVVLDLSGSREQYAALFDFLSRLGARKVAANTWWFVEDDVQRFEEYCKQLWSLLMSAAPNRPFPKDKVLVFLHGRGQFVGGPARELIEIGFAEPADEISEQSSIEHMLVTKSREELIAEGKIVQRY